MSNTTSFPKNTTGKLFLVSGLTGGREVFLGKAVDEPFQEHLTLEGKVLSATPNGRIVVRPFQTTVNFALHEAGYSVHHITNTAAHEEASKLLELAATHISRTAYPYVFRWVETAMQQVACETANESAGQTLAPHAADPFFGLYQGFRSTAEEFRRVLFRSHQIETTSELDRVTELEGDLLIEIGKITNQAAIKFNQILAQERGLSRYFEAIQVSGLPLGEAGHSMSGWPFLFERVQIAKIWARRNGKASLVRDVNAILKDGLFGLNEVILEHSNSLDTLITETFGQYGITHELAGEPDSSHGLLAPRPAPVVIGGTLLPIGG